MSHSNNRTANRGDKRNKHNKRKHNNTLPVAPSIPSTSIVPSSSPWSSFTRESELSVCNLSTLLGVDNHFLTKPSTVGRTFNVANARNYTGPDRSEVCVVKWVSVSHSCKKTGHPQNVVEMSKILARCVADFERDVGREWKLRVNMPRIWKTDGGKHKSRLVLAEPYVSNFTHFNSNSGAVRRWSPDVPNQYHSVLKVVNALSHYSYTWSHGKFVLCDLQGGVNAEQKIITLVDPAINSTNKGLYGCTDHGLKVLEGFFENHQCSSMCKHLPKPKDNKVFFVPATGSSVSGVSRF